MIDLLRGKINSISLNKVIIDVNGVGYGVFTPLKAAGALTVNKEAELHIYTAVRENDISLYGFLRKKEKDMFIKLLSVKGVGPKAALSVISTLSADDISEAVEAGDDKVFSAAPGIGKKTAQQIIIDLKGRIDLTRKDGKVSLTDEKLIKAKQGLINLGMTENDALNIVNELKEEKTTQDIIKKALTYLNK